MPQVDTAPPVWKPRPRERYLWLWIREAGAPHRIGATMLSEFINHDPIDLL